MTASHCKRFNHVGRRAIAQPRCGIGSRAAQQLVGNTPRLEQLQLALTRRFLTHTQCDCRRLYIRMFFTWRRCLPGIFVGIFLSIFRIHLVVHDPDILVAVGPRIVLFGGHCMGLLGWGRHHVHDARRPYTRVARRKHGQ